MVENEQERALHLQVSLEVGDYFRYYLDLIRMKILIAAVVYAVFTAALISFFIFIGEQELLLSLFLAFPAAVLVGRLLRAHASTRKYIADLSEVERIWKFSFRNDGNGYDVVRGDNFAHIAWSSIRSVVEKPRYFEFRFNKYESYIIPTKFFNSTYEKEFLREVLRSQLGSRAKLLLSNDN